MGMTPDALTVAAARNVRIVLVRPTHPGNIGAAARGMKNFGLSSLWLVAPRLFPHAEASARAAGADDLLAGARVVDDLAQAVADCHLVLGTSVRERGIGWAPMAPAAAAAAVREVAPQGPVAVVFGPEHSGLSNADLDLCRHRISIPTQPEFASMNLASAALIMAYEIMVGTGVAEVADAERAPGFAEPPQPPLHGHDEPTDHPGRPATAAEIEHLLAHLQQVLTALEFLRPSNPRKLMRRLRELVNRVGPDRNEVQILRGILSAIESRLGGDSASRPQDARAAAPVRD